MQHGFLGNDASFMLDFVVCALVLVIPVLVYSLWLVKFKHRYEGHRSLQIILGLILFLAVAAFEVDMQYHGGWKNIINKDPAAPRVSATELAEIQNVLYFHLIFAISTPILWVYTTVLALKRYPRPVRPGPHSRWHKTLGWLSTLDLVMTSVTGLYFYYIAFVQ